MRSETSRVRAGRDVLLVNHPGDETLLLVDRTSAKGGGVDVVRAVTGLSLDVIFPVLHGPYGEDGTIQGMLELAGVPYVGCGVLASSVGMDKAAAKLVFRASGLPVVDWVLVTRQQWRLEADVVRRAVDDALAYPVFVKPASLGSSLGITKVHSRADLGRAVDLALAHERRALVEAAVPEAREIECAVLGNERPETSLPGEIVAAREFYDYDAKYLDDQSRLVIPASLDDAQTATVRHLAVRAFEAIDGAGLARVDFLLSRSSGDLFVSEINTLPGFTTISMYAKLWAASNVDVATLVDRLITLALERHADRHPPREATA
jgi:D-alanine-D-alanine ligase